jgi:hypothetical protein
LPGVAKKKGVYKRHKSSHPVEIVRTMRGEGKKPTETTAALSLSSMSVWRALNA